MKKRTFIICLCLFITGISYILYNIMSSTGVYSWIPTPIMSKGDLQKMPTSSSYDYKFKENIIIHKILNDGKFLHLYYISFNNSNYDIDRHYTEFNSDMETYLKELQISKDKLSELNPSSMIEKSQQQNTLKKIDTLYTLIEDYRNHEKTSKDTVNYLSECRMELSRLFNSDKIIE